MIVRIIVGDDTVVNVIFPNEFSFMRKGLPEEKFSL